MFMSRIFSNDHPARQVENLARLLPTEGADLAIYDYSGRFDKNAETLIKKMDSSRKRWHLWAARISLSLLVLQNEDALLALEHELSYANELGVRDFILHFSLSESNDAHPDPVFMSKSVIPTLSLFIKQGFRPYVENVERGLPWLRPFFDTLAEQGRADELGFCFDVGHALSKTHERLDDYTVFLSKLSSRGTPLHSHLHINDGTCDYHWTIPEGARRGLLGARSAYPEGFLDWFDNLCEKVPSCHFCLEHKAEDAEEALSFLRKRRLEG